MSKLHEFKNAYGKLQFLCFHCPGCGYSHPVHIDPAEHPKGQAWEWNESMQRPTFRPSLLIFKDVPSMRCHSFVTDGKIQFLNDCFHGLAGQMVDIPDWGSA